jgi:hypothetical protein
METRVWISTRLTIQPLAKHCCTNASNRLTPAISLSVMTRPKRWGLRDPALNLEVFLSFIAHRGLS